VQEDEHLAELLLAPDERRRLNRQVRLVERLQRRELAIAELVDPLRRP
jgi:Trp operon repressor